MWLRNFLYYLILINLNVVSYLVLVAILLDSTGWTIMLRANQKLCNLTVHENHLGSSYKSRPPILHPTQMGGEQISTFSKAPWVMQIALLQNVNTSITNSQPLSTRYLQILWTIMPNTPSIMKINPVILWQTEATSKRNGPLNEAWG